MLRELAEMTLTPCAWKLRTMGYLSEVVGIGARYRRCRADWQPHLDNTQSLIRSAILECTERRKAVILGAGHLLDVPIDDLAAGFEEVVLVDLVHPLGARWRTRKLKNVRRLSSDVTASLEEIYRLGPAGGSLPRPRPTLLLDDSRVDLVASVNILSQLPFVPRRYLERWHRYPEPELDAFCRHVIESHLSYLRSFAATVALSTDVNYLTYAADGNLVEETSALYDVAILWPGEEWIWRLAPRPEIERGFDYFHRVRGMIVPKSPPPLAPP